MIPDLSRLDSGVRWLPVWGAEDWYRVGDHGRVWSNRKRRLLAPRPSLKEGYLSVDICFGDRVISRRTVHVLVARAFLGIRPDGFHVRHLNGDPADNRLVNLSYGTVSENVLDEVAHGTHNNASKTHCKWGHEFTTENTHVYYRSTGYHEGKNK